MQQYVIYARKSTETEDRQVLSIDSQVKELKDHAVANNMTIARVYSESRSAKEPGRPVFGRMLAEVGKTKVDGILCWKLDRLARNPVDGGALIWAVEQGSIREIATASRTFRNDGNDRFWMQLEFGMAKKYVDDLSDNVKRGNRAKLEQGWLPGVPPLGYLNDRAAKTIVKDPNRFPLVRKMWNLLLSGTRPTKIVDIANEQWGFRSPPSRRRGDGRIARSMLYRMFANPFYHGLIVRNGVSYEGAHSPMVTIDEFRLVQQTLGRPDRPRPKQYEWLFTGLIRCGECGASITAEHKTNRYGYRYIYYHCTKRKRGTMCTQRAIRAEALESQVMAMLSHLHVDDEVLSWAFQNLQETREKAERVDGTARRSLETTVAQLDAKNSRLMDLRLGGLISDEEYAHKREELVTEKHRLNTQLAQARSQPAAWFEPSAHTFLLANSAVKRFRDGSTAERREILVAVGSHLTLRDRILRTELQKPFDVIDSEGTSRNWCATSDKVRTYFMEHPHSIQWPAFCKDPQVLQRVKRRLFRKYPVTKRPAGSTRRA